MRIPSVVGRTIATGVWSGGIILAGCSGLPPQERYPEWPAPPEAPRVKLVRMVATSDDVGGRGVLDGFSTQGKRALFERPYGVAWDGADLIVTDPQAHRVVRIPPKGAISRSPEGLVTDPLGVAVMPDGIVVTEPRSGLVLLLDRSFKKKTLLLEGLNRPTGVAFDGTRLYVLETGRHVLRIREPDGTWREIGSRGEAGGEFNFPASVASGAGLLLVGDTLNFRIQKLEPATARALGSFGQLGDSAGEMPRVKGVAIDSARNIWVSDAILDQLALYDAEGNYLLSIGGQGTGPGQFNFPAGLAASQSGQVAVADSLGRRIQIFQLLPLGRN